MKKNLLLLLFFLLAVSISYGQEIKVKSFIKLERDLSARTKPQEDLNGEPCSLVKIVTAHAKDFLFEGNVVGTPIYNEGEIWVYMPLGSRRLTIRNDKYGVLRYDFPEKLAKQSVYEITVKLVEDPEKKVRTLVMPVIGIGKGHPSYGLMIGIVRNTGPYLKVKYDFSNLSTSMDVSDKGLIQNSGQLPWYTGEKKQSRFSATAGVIQRLGKLNPFYLYGGLGYGYNTLGWKTVDGEWAKNIDQSCSGLEAELGSIYRYKNLSASLGVQTNSFKYVEVNIGIGVMF